MALARRSFLFSALACTLLASGCGFHLRGQVTLPFQTLYVNKKRIKSSSGRHREVISVNMQGEDRDYELTLNMTFRLATPDGEEFFPPTTFTASRTMYYNDDEYLSRASEENVLYNEMQQDLISQLLSRLTTVEPIPHEY